MDLYHYIAIFWRRKWMIAITFTVTVAIVAVGSLVMTPIYEATTTLRVPTVPLGTTENVYYNLQYADRLLNTYRTIATSDPVLAQLMRRFGLGRPPEIEVEILARTELMQITVAHPNPTLASDVANALAEILVTQSKGLYIGEQIRRTLPREASIVSVVELAVPPQSPSRPSLVLNAALGAVLGLGGGVGLAFLFENLDTTLYGTEQIEQVTELPILAKIPAVKGRRPVALFSEKSPQAEACRYLRTRISSLNHGASSNKLLVTSAEPGEGKSTVTANLAAAIGRSGQRVIAVDADLRLPTLHKIFGLPNEMGLSNVLNQEATLDEAAQDSDIPGVRVLTSGPSPPSPAELLGSPQMTALIEQLAQQFDAVLLDTPSLLAVVDATELASTANGVVLVVGRAQAQREAVRAACRLLVDVQAKSIGTVVNRAERNRRYDYYSRAAAQRHRRVPKVQDLGE